jgi:UDP-N-acetylglucosamine transferase subunit ALG13
MTIEEKTTAAKNLLNSFFGGLEESNFAIACHDHSIVISDKETGEVLTTSRLDIHYAYTTLSDGNTEVAEVDDGA